MNGPDRFHIENGETIATIICQRKYLRAACREIEKQRRALISYIRRDGYFRTTFEPAEPRKGAPGIARRMARAAQIAGVGPMAAVAGAIAQCAVEAMVDEGATFAVFDNGGDIALCIDRPVTVGIYAGSSEIRDIGFLVEPREGIFGICTSSGTVGPSISLGMADAATVIAGDAAVADAAATALGNAVKNDKARHIGAVLRKFPLRHLEGAAVITHNHMGVLGKFPPLVWTGGQSDMITKGKSGG